MTAMNPEFTPAVWPEEAAPADKKNCSGCELACQRTRVIWGEGNPQAPIMVVLDNPGAREDAEGNPYVCGTRQTLQLAVFEAGLGMEDLYVTYILKCRPVRKYDKPAARSTCLVHLDQQLRIQKPDLAFCLGDTAVQWFFGDMSATVKQMRGTWHLARELPVAVSYHPLAVRRRPNLYRLFASDWKMLAARFNVK